MKYWNKQRDYRRLHWSTVPGPEIHRMNEAKLWCQRNPSPGKFYFHFTNTKWWFENKEDAVAFALAWSKPKNA